MAKEVEKYSRRSKQTNFVSIIVGISLVLFMLGIVLGAFIGVDTLEKDAKENVTVDLFFYPNLNDADIKLIEKEVRQLQEVKNVEFISSDKALEYFENESGKQAGIIKAIYDGESPLPPSISFKLKAKYVNKEAIANLKLELLKKYNNQVNDINYNEHQVENVNLQFLRFVYMFGIIGLLLTIIAFAIINNTIRLALFSKRFTIKTMQLVGAKASFIRRPYLAKAILQGFLSAIIGLALLMGTFYALIKFYPSVNEIYTIYAASILAGALVILGILISYISTWFALNKYLRKKLDDLY